MKPSVAEVTEYIKAFSGIEPDDYAAQKALDAEAAAQARRCRTPTGDDWPADLREALMRRVAVNLAVRPLTTGIQASPDAAGVGFARVGGRDAEVQRLEAPYRRMIVG